MREWRETEGREGWGEGEREMEKKGKGGRDKAEGEEGQ